jgi:hypothetical protein
MDWCRHGHEDLNDLIASGLTYGLNDDVEQIGRVGRLLCKSGNRHDADRVSVLKTFPFAQVPEQRAQRT